MAGKQFPDEIVGALRAALIGTAVVGIVLGLVAVIWPGATALVLSVLFGISLIVFGILRIAQAAAATLLPTGWRVIIGVLGALVALIGLISLLSPANSFYLLAAFIGIGLIFQSVADLSAGFSGSTHAPRAWLLASGVIGLLAGIAMIALPHVAFTAFVWASGIMLIAASVASLLTLPKKVAS